MHPANHPTYSAAELQHGVTQSEYQLMDPEYETLLRERFNEFMKNHVGRPDSPNMLPRERTEPPPAQSSSPVLPTQLKSDNELSAFRPIASLAKSWQVLSPPPSTRSPSPTQSFVTPPEENELSIQEKIEDMDFQ